MIFTNGAQADMLEEAKIRCPKLTVDAPEINRGTSCELPGRRFPETPASDPPLLNWWADGICEPASILPETGEAVILHRGPLSSVGIEWWDRFGIS
jgi:hypothetical protein